MHFPYLYLLLLKEEFLEAGSFSSHLLTREVPPFHSPITTGFPRSQSELRYYTPEGEVLSIAGGVFPPTIIWEIKPLGLPFIFDL